MDIDIESVCMCNIDININIDNKGRKLKKEGRRYNAADGAVSRLVGWSVNGCPACPALPCTVYIVHCIPRHRHRTETIERIVYFELRASITVGNEWNG